MNFEKTNQIRLIPHFAFKMDVLRFLLPVVLVFSSFLGCTKSTDKSTGPSDKKTNEKNQATFAVQPDADTFVFRVRAEPTTLDPAKGVDGVNYDILVNLGEGLLQPDDNMVPQPCLAESYKISRDSKVYTFKIRKNVKWTDGTALTSKHFAEAWQRLLDPTTGSPYAYFLFDIVNAEEYNSQKLTDYSKVGVETPDDHTLIVKLKKPASYWSNVVTFPVTFPGRKDLYDKFGDKWSEDKNFQSVGPYKLVKWEHDQKIVLARNDDYWGGRPSIKSAIGVILEDASTSVSLFEAGKIDLVRRIPAFDVERFQTTPFFGESPYLRGYFYGFNINKAPFNKVSVRKALAHAIPRADIPKATKGGEFASSSWIPRGLLGFNDQIGLQFDPEKAKKLLAEAGYPDGKGFPKFKLTFDTREDNKIIAEQVQAAWKKHLNIQCEVVGMEWKVHQAMLQTDPPEVYRSGWGADYPDPHNFMEVFVSNSGHNYAKWKNLKYDSFVTQAASVQDRSARQKLYDQAQRILTEEDAPIVPLFNESMRYLLQPRVKNFKLDSVGNLYIKRYQLSLK